MSDAEHMAGERGALPMLTRAELWAQVAARRAGTLTDVALAAWAFKQFYDEDMNLLEFEHAAEEEIRDVLDTLMFADESAFALDDQALDELLDRLQP